MKPYDGRKMKTILNPNLPWRREDETRCSAKSIDVLPTKHHLTSVQNSCQTQVYTMKSIRELKDRKQFRHAVQR